MNLKDYLKDKLINILILLLSYFIVLMLLIAFKVIKYVSIALLAVLSTIDFVGAIASNDNDILKKTISKILKRFILCILIFLLPTIIEFVLRYVYDQSINLCGIK